MPRLPRLARALALILLLAGNVQARADTLPAATIDAIFAAHNSPREPGCSLGIYQHDKLSYARGYGMANLEYSLPNGPDTVFRIASVSKQFMATAIALLDEAGQLSLDDTLDQYYPAMGDYARQITLRQLVYHTSGIRDYLELADMADWGEWYTVDEALALILRQQTTNFVPGEESIYSNSGYLLLADVLQQVTGMQLHDWAEHHLFAPLGMAHTLFQDDHSRLISKRADGYRRGEDGAWHRAVTQLDMVGDGGIYTTVEDLLQWHKNFTDNRLGQGRQTLIELLETSHELPDGTNIHYGFGLSVNEFMGQRVVEHGGSWVGYRAHLQRYPEVGLGIAVLCNAGDASPGALARQVAQLLLPNAQEPAPAPGPANRPETPDLSRQQMERWLGRYWNEQDLELGEIVLDGETLAYQGPWSKVPLVASSPSRFYMDAPGWQPYTLYFEEDADGTPTLRMEAPGETAIRMQQLAAYAPSANTLQELVGAYHSAELAHVAQLRATENELLLIRRAGARSLSPIRPDLYQLDGTMTLAFQRDEKGQINGMQMHSGRVRGIRYKRR